MTRDTYFEPLTVVENDTYDLFTRAYDAQNSFSKREFVSMLTVMTAMTAGREFPQSVSKFCNEYTAILRSPAQSFCQDEFV